MGNKNIAVSLEFDYDCLHAYPTLISNNFSDQFEIRWNYSFGVKILIVCSDEGVLGLCCGHLCPYVEGSKLRDFV